MLGKASVFRECRAEALSSEVTQFQDLLPQEKGLHRDTEIEIERGGAAYRRKSAPMAEVG